MLDASRAIDLPNPTIAIQQVCEASEPWSRIRPTRPAFAPQYQGSWHVDWIPNAGPLPCFKGRAVAFTSAVGHARLSGIEAPPRARRMTLMPMCHACHPGGIMMALPDSLRRCLRLVKRLVA